MANIKVLIVDDSSLTREILRAIFSSVEGVEVVDSAENGLEALSKLEVCKPDIITMDISMPQMDGMETIQRIMANNPTPILVISDITDSNVAFVALTHGALEVIPKSWLQPEKADDLANKVKLLANVKVIRHIRIKDSASKEAEEKRIREKPKPKFDKIIAIACSTGGPKALNVILSNLPQDYPYPILVAQHIDADFVDSLVEFLNNASPMEIVKGREGDLPSLGTVYISPGNKHMTVSPLGSITLSEIKPGELYTPSCNRLLISVGETFGESSIGVILTGMGNDGVEGMKKIKEVGGATIAQDEKSSIVFGMPNVAIESNCIDKVLPLKDISAHLKQLSNKHPG